MPLKLRVISEHYKVLGPRRSQLFGVTGGRIGRAPDNDWVLPDTQHFISGHHATVAFRAGSWMLEDTSRNGVYLNGSEAPVADSGPAKLMDGDRLRFGEYEVLVTIDDHTDFAADVSGQMPIPSALREPGAARKARSEVVRRTSKQEAPPVKAPDPINLDEFLKPDLEATDVLTPSRRGKSGIDALASSASINLNVESLGASSEAVAEFCRGLGVDPKSLPSRSRSALLIAAGQLLRETAVQLSRTLKQQSERANSDQVAGAQDNPLLAAPTHESTVFRLLGPSRTDIPMGVDLVRDAFDRIRDYEDAYDSALATALSELLSRINPARIAARTDQASGSRFVSSKKDKYWDMFSEVFAAIDQRDERGWPTVLSREFAKALATQLRDRHK